MSNLSLPAPPKALSAARQQSPFTLIELLW